VVSLWATALLGVSLLGVVAHPLHTSVTQLIQEKDTQSIRVELRLFADDLKTAIEAAPADAGFESLISTYVGQHLVLSDMGAPIPLRLNGADLVGDVVLVRLSAAPTRSLSGVQVANTVLCERFPDQVNVVRATYEGRSATLIFTRGDAAKPLP
jgi:hypothetical protein